MNLTIAKPASLGAVLGAVLLAGPAFADGMPKRGKVRAPEPAPRACVLSANVALTSEYVFRGISQTAETPTIQGGFDATCGIFYAGLWGSGLDFDGFASVEIDYYAGIKPKTGPITWDLGVIYYTYPRADDAGAELNYVELKVGASGEIWKDGTLGATVFYSPEYTGEIGPVWTIEGSFSQALRKFGMFSPTFSALIGYNTGSSDDYEAFFDSSDYTYWNVGLTLGFLEKWSLDLRYWDTNLEEGTAACGTGRLFSCDERFVATLKFTY